MSRFNQYMNSHFSGCRLLAEGFDACRGREVSAYLLPGYHADVGFSDGTDAWIVPLAAESCTGAGNLLRGVNLRELVGRILNGESPAVIRRAPAPKPAGRRRLSDDVPVPEPNGPAPARRRIELQDHQPAANRRRHVSI